MQKIILWFCEKNNGKLYIGDFLDGLSEETYGKINIKLNHFQEFPSYTIFLKSKHIKYLDKKTRLCELRFKMQGHWYRFLGEWRKEVFHIVYAFRKKSNQTPIRHIDTANERLLKHCK